MIGGGGSLRYYVPAGYVEPRYSSDPGEFMAQYYGFFSCEGQGLERIPHAAAPLEPRQ